MTPCYGKSALFDSTELEDHIEARALCETCPTLIACMRNLADVKRTSASYGQPEGTWAGQLLAPDKATNRRSQRRIESEDERYDDQQAKVAHNQWRAGKRDPWTRTGERVYQARRKRAERARKKVA